MKNEQRYWSLLIGRLLDLAKGSTLRIGLGAVLNVVGALKINGTTVTSSAAELNTMTGILATAAELNRAADVSTRLVACGAALTLTVADHDGKIILLDTAAGSVATLPAATGSGAVFKFLVSVVATSNSHKVQVTGNDVMQGLVFTVSDNTNAVLGWRTADDSDTITLDRSTTGSVERGEYLELVDAGADLYLVRGFTASTGTEATPFSAAV